MPNYAEKFQYLMKFNLNLILFWTFVLIGRNVCCETTWLKVGDGIQQQTMIKDCFTLLFQRKFVNPTIALWGTQYVHKMLTKYMYLLGLYSKIEIKGT